MFLKISILLSLLVTLSVAANAQNPIVGTKLPIVNGLATDLQKPDFSQEAKDFCAAGIVSVKVEIDEKGNVISAEAITGDELLRESSVQAAKKSKFAVTRFGSTPVKVKGVVVYNFTSEKKCITAGIVNKRAVFIPKPEFPKSCRCAGEVKVEVIIDILSGKVTSVRAVSGNPLLRIASVESAKKAVFSPSMINTNQQFSAKGLLIYNFSANGKVKF